MGIPGIIAFNIAYLVALIMASTLQAKPRTELGKKVSALRRAGFLPAVVYGENVKSQPITVPYKDFEKAYKAAGESTLVTLDVEGKKYNVLIHDIKHDPLRGKPIHADFYAVRMDKVIRAKVVIELFGESPAVKNESGILIKVMKEMEVEALPQDLPHELRADLSALDKLESRLLVKDILLPKGVKIFVASEEVIAIVETPRSEEELAALKETPATEAPIEVKTEREVKVEMKEKEAPVEEGGKEKKKGLE